MWGKMPEVIDTPEEIGLHKLHVDNPQPETCDLCWMEAPWNEKEIEAINEALKEMGDKV